MFALRVFFPVLMLVAGSACATRQKCAYPPALSRPQDFVQLGPTDTTPHVTEADVLKKQAEQARTSHSPAQGCGKKYLALSGGGMYGAYSAGFLAGWSAKGDRPTFDVVTGVSTGALIACYAFLGPDYDPAMIDAYTNITDRDVYRKRRPVAVLWSESAADSAPLEKMIAARVDAAFLEAVGQAHRTGRRLYIGTTNLDSRRLVVWDMGAIATSGRPDALELFRKILLASASPPGFFPPVPIEVTVNGRRYTELHADGGATAGLFLRTATAENRDADKPLAGSEAYVIVAGKLYSDPSLTPRRVVKIGESGLQSLLYSQTRGELYRIYTLCVLGGMDFRMTAVPQEYPAPEDAMGFDRAEMRKLYRLGFENANRPGPWRDTPPGTRPGEDTRPRTGPDFFAPTP